MDSQFLSYQEWQTRRNKTEAWVHYVNELMPPYERKRPRDPDEAEFLRRIGTPDHLIGPVIDLGLPPRNEEDH
jgi:hypothetical protein